MSAQKRVEGPTATHAQPRAPSRPTHRPAFVAAFPRSVGMLLPPAGTPVGRDWLLEYGLADHEVSGRHLQLHRAGPQLQIEDVGSRNGTWLDGSPLRAGERASVTDGAVIRLGRTLLVYREALEGPLNPSEPLGPMVGPFGLRQVESTLAAFRRNPPSNVLIQGQTGTGKELAAAAVAHTLGRGKAYAAVNVAGVPAGVFESQLFGHVAGAFSDARRASKGVVAAHDGGAVFLDEIGELALELQPKLLRLLENREVLPVGAERPIKVNVLLIAATNRDLPGMVEQGLFRQDLHARMATTPLSLPPLQERAEDIYAIVQGVGPACGLSLDPAAENVEVEAVERLLLEPWPNNVRGLMAALHAAAIADLEPGLHLWSVERVVGPAPSARPGELAREMVQAALDACGGNESEASRRLGISRGRLRRFLGKV